MAVSAHNRSNLLHTIYQNVGHTDMRYEGSYPCPTYTHKIRDGYVIRHIRYTPALEQSPKPG